MFEWLRWPDNKRAKQQETSLRRIGTQRSHLGDNKRAKQQETSLRRKGTKRSHLGDNKRAKQQETSRWIDCLLIVLAQAVTCGCFGTSPDHPYTAW